MQYTIDLSPVYDRHGFYDLLQKELPLPDYFGRNLDALYDALTDRREPLHITFTGSACARERLAGYFCGIQQVFADAAQAGVPVSVQWLP